MPLHYGEPLNAKASFDSQFCVMSCFLVYRSTKTNKHQQHSETTPKPPPLDPDGVMTLAGPGSNPDNSHKLSCKCTILPIQGLLWSCVR